jgi:hypothetical protein
MKRKSESYNKTKKRALEVLETGRGTRLDYLAPSETNSGRPKFVIGTKWNKLGVEDSCKLLKMVARWNEKGRSLGGMRYAPNENRTRRCNRKGDRP